MYVVDMLAAQVDNRSFYRRNTMRKLASMLVVGLVVITFGAQGASAENLEEYWFTGDGVDTPSLAGDILEAPAEIGDPPSFEYDQESGILSVVAGDNYVASLAIFVTRDKFVKLKLEDVFRNAREDRIDWDGFAWSDVIDIGDTKQNGRNGTYPVVELIPGLTAADFGPGIEWTAVPDPMSPEIDEGTTPVTVIPIPEPATMALLGLGGIAALSRRRRRR